MSGNASVGVSGRTFETHRIAVLQGSSSGDHSPPSSPPPPPPYRRMTLKVQDKRGEREKVQKKTFTKWCNSHLARVSLKITDLYTDLSDGRILMKLLEVLSGDKLPKPHKGQMRIHKLENLGHVFSYLKHAKIKVESMGSADILDSNTRLILGLIWTIILRFQIQDITFETEDAEKKSAKEALLLWTQRRTKGYRGVNVTNFTTSWKDGLAFAALIHKHRPDIVDFDDLQKENVGENLTMIFNTAEKDLGIPRLLDEEDVNVDYPDEKSIITYVANYYHTFAKMQTGDVGSRRIVKIITFLQECESMQSEYNRLATSLLEWIEQTIIVLGNRELPNMLAGVQALLGDFSVYRTVEKPPKYVEKGTLEVLFYNLNTKLRSQKQPGFQPESGKLLSDVAKRWSELEAAEHDREVTLREEVLRLERLERMAEKFGRKAGMRATWLLENQKLVSEDNFGNGIAAVEAARKKHESIQTDIRSYETRVQGVVDMAGMLETEKYWGIDRVKEDLDKVLEMWEVLLHSLVGRRQRLDEAYNYAKALTDVNDLIEYLADIKSQVQSTDYGKHLVDVDVLLQKHSLVEAEIGATEERINQALGVDVPVPESEFEGPDLATRCEVLQGLVNEVNELRVERKAKLNSSLLLHRFYEDVDNEEEWIGEKSKIVSTALIGTDLPSATSLSKHHELFLKEVASHDDIVDQVCLAGEELVSAQHYDSDNISHRITELKEHYDKLKTCCEQRDVRLNEVVVYQTYRSDAEEMLLWLIDMEKLVENEDLGRDEASAQLLLKKHKTIEDEINAYERIIQSLKQQQDALSTQDRLRPETRELQETIEEKYRDIISSAKQRRQLLVFAYSLFLLYREADEVESWIEEKKSMLDTIKAPQEFADMDIVERRFDSFIPELEAYEYRIGEVADLGDQMIEKTHPRSEEIQERIDEINKLWQGLHDLVELKRVELISTISLQQFKNSLEYCVNWISCKAKALLAIQTGEVANLDTKTRTVNLIEKELQLLEDKIQQLKEGGEKQDTLSPSERDQIDASVLEVTEQWAELNKLLSEKKRQLESTSHLRDYLSEADSFLLWLNDTTTEAGSTQLDSGIARVDAKIKQHNDLRAEIDSFQPQYQKLLDTGEEVQNTPGAQTETIKDKLAVIIKGWEVLGDKWDERAHLLNQCRDLQLFNRDARLAENTLNQQDNVLEEMKSSTASPEVRIRKLQQFEKLEALADSKIEGLKAKAEELVSADHYASEEIHATIGNLQKRHAENAHSAADAEDAINTAKRLHKFVEDCGELDEWLRERGDALSEDSLRDPALFPALRKSHEALKHELEANKPWLTGVETEGEDIKSTSESDTPLIDKHLVEVTTSWHSLETMLAEKEKALQEAEHAHRAGEKMSDLEVLVSEMENALRVGDIGDDLASTKQLSKKHQMLETDLNCFADEIDGLELICEDVGMDMSAPPTSVNIQKENIKARFAALQEPLEKKKKKLGDSYNLKEFNRMAGDEEQWVKEKAIALDTTDLGTTLMEAETLLQKHKLFSEDVSTHTPTYHATIKFGDELIADDHYGSNIIEARLAQLKGQWDDIQSKSTLRMALLEENNLTQKFYSECSEAESYLKEIAHLITTDTPADEASAETMLTKHKSVQASIEDYKDNVTSLKTMLDELSEQKHPLLSTHITSQSVRLRNAIQRMFSSAQGGSLRRSTFTNRYNFITEAYRQLDEKSKLRRKVLEDAYNLFHFNREVTELHVYISSKEVVASSGDLGRDYEHVQVLESKFDEFYSELTTVGQSRVEELGKSAASLISNEHTMTPDIQEAQGVVERSWAKLLELSLKRKATLSSSVELHKYHRDADELMSRVQAADASIPSDLGRDVSTVQALQRKHQSMAHDVQAIGAQVSNLVKEAERLEETYPGARAKGVSERQKLKSKMKASHIPPHVHTFTLPPHYHDAVEHRVTPLKALVMNSWTRLQEHLILRKEALSSSSRLFTFLRAANQLIQWATNMRKTFVSDDIGSNVSAVELQIAQHNDLKGEMDARVTNKTECEGLGAELIEGQEFPDIVQEKLDQLKEVWSALYSDWEEAEQELDIMLEAHSFARDAGAASIWINNQSGNLTETPATATLDHIEALLRKFENFERAINAQSERFSAFEKITRYEQKDGAGRRPTVQASIEQEEEERTRRDNKLAIEIARQLQDVHNDTLSSLTNVTPFEAFILTKDDDDTFNHSNSSLEQFSGDGKASEWKRKSEVERDQTKWIAEAEKENVVEEEEKVSLAEEEEDTSIATAPGGPLTKPPSKEDLYEEIGNGIELDVPEILTSTPVISVPKSVEFNESVGVSLDFSAETTLAEDDKVWADGKLMRKIEFDVGNMKPKNTNWMPCYVSVRKGNLVFYKDDKAQKEGISMKEEPLFNCTVAANTDSKKKKNVFRFKSIVGSSYLFQASSPAEHSKWIEQISEARDDFNLKQDISLSNSAHGTLSPSLSPPAVQNSVISEADSQETRNSETKSTTKDNKAGEPKKGSAKLKKKKPSIFRKKQKE